MKRGYVVAVHPEDHSVDVALSNGQRLTGVQVLSHIGASEKTGTFNMPTVPETDGDKWDVSEKKHDKYQIAIVDYVDDMPVVVGFLYPQISQMTFPDKDLFFFRHQSDTTVSIEADGSIQISHPGGTYLRIGDSPEPKEHEGTNADESLERTENVDLPTTVRIGVRDGGDHMVKLTMQPDGKVELLAGDDITVIGQKNVKVEAKEKASVKAWKGVNITAVTGGVNVDAYLGGVNVNAYQGGINATAYTGGITASAYQGGVGVVAYTGNVDIAATVGRVNVLGAAGVTVESSGAIVLTSATHIRLAAPRIDLN